MRFPALACSSVLLQNDRRKEYKKNTIIFAKNDVFHQPVNGLMQMLQTCPAEIG
jgi:hypothetical protein